ncbi:MAG TPA: hypothetical protein VLV86_22865 [Vicinamibacterales bacterium]|nr:hypothetical protein [Vicinamibacterales bacterium]
MYSCAARLYYLESRRYTCESCWYNGASRRYSRATRVYTRATDRSHACELPVQPKVVYQLPESRYASADGVRL